MNKNYSINIWFDLSLKIAFNSDKLICSDLFLCYCKLKKIK